MIVPLLWISLLIVPSSRIAPSHLRVPSKVVRSPIRLSTSEPSATPRLRRCEGRPTLTSPGEARKLGPAVDEGGAAEDCAAAAFVESLVSGMVEVGAASSRSLDSAPRNL